MNQETTRTKSDDELFWNELIDAANEERLETIRSMFEGATLSEAIGTTMMALALMCKDNSPTEHEGCLLVRDVGSAMHVTLHSLYAREEAISPPTSSASH